MNSYVLMNGTTIVAEITATMVVIYVAGLPINITTAMELRAPHRLAHARKTITDAIEWYFQHGTANEKVNAKTAKVLQYPDGVLMGIFTLWDERHQ